MYPKTPHISDNTHLVPVRSHGLSCCLAELLPIKLSSSAVVLLLCVGGDAVVAAEKRACFCISSKLHLPELLPAPVSVKVGGADECQMDTQGPDIKTIKYSFLKNSDRVIFNVQVI